MKRTELVDTMDGNGQVTSKGEHACEVRYTMRVYQDVVIAQSERLLGHESIKGDITVVRGDDGPLFDGEDLVLHLDDGQKLRILVAGGTLGSGVWSIVGNGGFFTD